ncbi:MAG: MFS transporter [Deltaproteobacteria bacterium]|nr:MFS transporter [Deltaproteobacteria bacterium]
MQADTSNEAGSIEARAYARVGRKLLPFLFVLYVVAYLDRINVGFAALQMNRQLGLSEAVFGFGAGIFFVGYFILEIPSNLLLQRIGARVWISRIMISWGIVALAMMLTRGSRSFYLLRFMLGAAEAGFFPGIIFYLTRWFTARERAHAISYFMTATQIAGVIGGPLSGLLLAMNGVWGLAGWQWLFLAEGLPAVMLGVAVAGYLPDGPGDANWLTSDERQRLLLNLAAEQGGRTEAGHTLRDALTSARVWLLTLLYFTIVFGHYGIALWLPQLLKTFGGLSDLKVGCLSSIPFLVAAVAMVLVAKHSDSTQERRWHLALSAFIGGIALAACAGGRTALFSLVTISIAAAGVSSTAGPFWTLPSEFLDGAAAAGGIALINSIGNLAGFVGPSVVGLIRQLTHSFAGGLGAMAAAVLIAGIIALALPHQRRLLQVKPVLEELETVSKLP